MSIIIDLSILSNRLNKKKKQPKTPNSRAGSKTKELCYDIEKKKKKSQMKNIKKL